MTKTNQQETMKQKFILLVAVLAMAVNASAYDFQVDGIYYNILSDLTCEVTGNSMDGNSYSGDIVIPSTVTNNGNTFSVISIGCFAFEQCSNLTSVKIPDSVTSIEKYAFQNSPMLTSVEIPNSVTEIGYFAFGNCSKLTSVEIPNSVTKIARSTFWNCSNLTSVVIGNSVTKILEYAFGNCSNLTSVVIGSSVTEIESYAFENCSNIKEITLLAVAPPERDWNTFSGVTTKEIVLKIPTKLADNYIKSSWNDRSKFGKIDVLY